MLTSRLAIAGLLLAASCSGGLAAGWSYKASSEPLLPKGATAYTAASTSAEGFTAEFRCDSLSRRVTFTAEIEAFTDKKPRKGEPTIIDFKVSKLKAAWSVDGGKPAVGQWKKSRGSVFAEGAVAAQILAAASAGRQELRISSGKAAASYSLSGAGTMLGLLAKACNG